MPNVGMDVLKIELTDIHSIDGNGPPRDIVSPHGQIGDGALAGTGVADQRCHLAFEQIQIELF